MCMIHTFNRDRRYMEKVWHTSGNGKCISNSFFCSFMEAFRRSEFEHLLSKLHTHTHILSLMMVFSINNIFFLGNTEERAQKLATYK